MSKIPLCRWLGAFASGSLAAMFVTSKWSVIAAAEVLKRHSVRRRARISTVSVLAGPLSAGARLWREWTATEGRESVTTSRPGFPLVDWVRTAVAGADLTEMAARYVSAYLGRNAAELYEAWRTKTDADRDQFLRTLGVGVDNGLLGIASLILHKQQTPDVLVSKLRELPEIGLALLPEMHGTVPAVLFAANAIQQFAAQAAAAAHWATLSPALPIAITTHASVWQEYKVSALESRIKAILCEGEVLIPAVDPANAQLVLQEAGAGERADLFADRGFSKEIDPALVEAAAEAVRATAASPATRAEADRARSAAERFLFEFVQSLPETMGRFELNGCLDFPFGGRPIEVDLLCRSPRLAIELDGYFHFVDRDCYRRDRAKDWELQRRGYLVLRFLAEDVMPNLELIRERILDALAQPGVGA